MLRPGDTLDEFERWYAREHLEARSLEEAIRVFEALWRLARELNPDFPGSWQEDIAPDIELARVLNALPEDA
jgi:hypothetical protein